MRTHASLLTGTVFGAALVGLVGSGCGRDEPAGTDVDPANDMAVASVVERRIQREVEGPAAANIDVQVTDGVATLSGSVPDASTKAEAEDVAEDVEGVDRVENQIVIAMGGMRQAPESDLGD
jgi:osmotically-inducible protein OsmY